MENTLRHSPIENRVNSGHFIILDWMRFLAALLVVLCHIRPEHWVAWRELEPSSQGLVPKVFFLLIRAGPEAVVAFFVLSGYLVGGKVIARWSDGTFSAADYYRDRASRIFTPLLPAFLLTIGCVWFLHSGFPNGFGRQLLGNLFQMQGILCERLEGNAPLWSLSYEVWFYVLGGALAVLFMRRAPSMHVWQRTLAAALASVSLWCLITLQTTYLLCWLMGAIVYVFPNKNPVRSRVVAGFIFALIGVVMAQATGSYQGGLLGNSDVVHKAGTLLLAASLAFLLPFLVDAGTRCGTSRLLRLGPSLAAFSYTLYLTHYPLLLVMRTWHEPYRAFTAFTVLVYLLKLGVCLLAAWLLYLPFERNTPKVRRFIQRLFPGNQPVAASPLPCAKS